MISVSIVTYNNSLDDVLSCISRFVDCDLISEVVICENSEVPNLSSEDLLCFNKKLKYVSNHENTGYGAGHNLAYSSLIHDGKYHVVMNLDVEVSKNVFESIYFYMEDNADVLQAMPKVLNVDGTIQRLCKKLPTPLNLIGRRFIKGKGFSDKIDRDYTLSDYDYNEVLDCPYLSGCFMFLRREAFENVGGFDERFFMYPEDIDLTRRLHDIGRTVCYPFVSVIHEHGQASYKSRKMLIIHIKGIIKYFNKWGWVYDKKRRLYNRELVSKLEK